MKIGLDLKFIENENIYSKFVLELVNKMIIKDQQNFYNIYVSKDLKIEKTSNTKIILWDKKNYNLSIKDDFLFSKKLKSDKNNLMVFFKIKKPIFFRWDYIVFIPTLKDIYYQNFDNFIQKYKFIFFIKNALKKANKIVCFDQNTKDELNERFNVKYESIFILPWFFLENKKLIGREDLTIDLKIVSNIKNDFFVYSCWSWIEKNLERLITIFKRLRDEEKNIDLVILCEQTSRNLDIRKMVLEYSLQERVHFLWEIEDNKKIIYYKNSLWVIFPSLYETFPFKLSDAIFFSKPIIASNNSNIKDVFKETIKYFSPISVSDMKKNIEEFLKKKFKPNYNSLLEKYNSKKSANKLIEIINKL